MRTSLPRSLLAAGSILLTSTAAGEEPLPWRQAGLSERQAAVHLLDRLTYGPRPGDVEQVLLAGLSNWLEQQLQDDAPGAGAAAELARWTTLSMASEEIARSTPSRTAIVAEAVAKGVVRQADYDGEHGDARRRRAHAAVDDFAEQRGYLPAGRVIAEMRAQKLYRALHSDSQLVEVLTEMWFNHFNVSAGCAECQAFLPSYENGAIRPHVLGTFRELLGATAQHPAMLLYLGNARSRADPDATTTFEHRMSGFDRFSPSENPSTRQRLARALRWRPAGMTDPSRRYEGLNENYARELLELHTLGVDGGYGQHDVVEVARAFTGWTIFPQGAAGENQRLLLEQAVDEVDLGFAADGEFLFRADWHDAGAKSVLGVALPAERGIEDGLQVLDLLARHPATARRVAWRLAVRFVADDPPPALVERLARTFELSGGDLRALVRTLVASPEFWRDDRRQRKLKTPLELVASALRALDAEVAEPWPLIEWIARAGQPLYEYAAPTGYPDRAGTWSSTGSLLARINFGQALGRGTVQGVVVDPLRHLGDLEPASVPEALRALLPRVLPGRPPGKGLAALAELDGSAAVKTARVEAGDASVPGDPAARRQAENFCRIALALLIASPEFQER